MRRHRFRPDDDAVSPVVGVVLLVGIAVMLMTTIGVFVLGFGPGEQAPESDVQFSQDTNKNVTITAVRPAGLVEQEVRVQVNGQPACYTGSGWDSTGSIDTGESITVDEYGTGCSNSMSSGDTVQVIWRSEGGGQSDLIGEYEVI